MRRIGLNPNDYSHRRAFINVARDLKDVYIKKWVVLDSLFTKFQQPLTIEQKHMIVLHSMWQEDKRVLIAGATVNPSWHILKDVRDKILHNDVVHILGEIKNNALIGIPTNLKELDRLPRKK